MVGLDFTFKRFAQQSFYGDLNSRLVDLLQIRPGQVVLDLACGTGAVTKLILEKVRGAQESLVIGIDSSASALRQARSDLQTSYDSMVQFIQGRMEYISEAVRRSADAVVLCNAIHMVQDKARLVSEVRGVLRPDGLFAFNSAFFQGAIRPETEQFYRRWMFKALRKVRSNYGLIPQNEKVESRKMLSTDQYRELLEQHGFHVVDQKLEIVDMPLEAWEDISSYDEFVQGALPGIPTAQASAALREAVGEVFQELKIKAVPRGWLTVVAART